MFIRSKSGFSIMEVMVGMGMLGVLTFGFLQYQKSSVASQKKTEVQNALNSVETRILTELAARDACNQTFVDDGTVINKKNAGQAKGFSFFHAKNPATGVSYSVLKKGDIVDTKGLLIFDRIDQNSSGSDDELVFFFKHKKTNQEYQKKFKVLLTTNTNGTIKGCTGKSEAELQKVQNDAVTQAVELACTNAGGKIQTDGTCKVTSAKADQVDTKKICDGTECFTIADVTALKNRVAALESKTPTADNSGVVADCLSRNLTYDSSKASCTQTCTTAGYIYDSAQKRCDPDTKSLRCLVAKGVWNSTDQSCEFIGSKSCPTGVGSIFKYHYKSSSSGNNPKVCYGTYPGETTWRNNVICTIQTGWYAQTPTCQFEVPVSSCIDAQCSLYGCSHTPANCTSTNAEMVKQCAVHDALQVYKAPENTWDGVSCK